MCAIPVLWLAITSLAFAQAPATRASTAPKPTKAVPMASCVTAECHPNIKQYKAVHAPVVDNACDSCHKLADEKNHAFFMVREKAEMCTFCHEFNVEKVPVVHLPVAKGECLGCHSPHGGVDKRMTRENTTGELCGRCHDNMARGRKFVHDPVAKGECTTCHSSHASRFPKLLYAEGEAMCLSCHKKFEEQMANAKFVHKAMKEGCSKCHESHASNLPKQTKMPTAQLCGSCHDKLMKEVAQARYKHTVVTSERACLTCHTSHGGDLAKLMTDLPIRACMNCHNEKVKTDRGFVVAAMPELTDPATNKHGPIADGQCGACHQVHGSQQEMFLVRSNSSSLYQSMAAENYRLCFGCHDVRLGQDPTTASATSFRNGDLNLHYIHVNRGQRGRNCRICHNTHASHNPKHVNDTSRFGNWAMPIKFTRTETGGHCDTGCHLPWAYDRVKPATRPVATRATTLPLVGPATQPSPTPDTPKQIRWTLTSSLGVKLKVPRDDRPTIAVFTRTAHGQQQEMKDLVARAGIPLGGAQVVLILGGEDATKEALRMAKANEVPWPIVADPSDGLFGAMEVHVWPTTIVLRPDGTPAARVAGVPESLASALPLYVDFAAGKIDRAELAKKLETHVNVGDTPARRAARQVELAGRLADAGNFAQAKEILAASLVQQPDSVPIRIELVKVLTRLGQSPEAMKLLDGIAEDALSPGQSETLRGGLFLDQREWRRAAEVLGRAIAKNPKLGEAHYLMGRVHEYNGDWQAAAREYRTARELGN